MVKTNILYPYPVYFTGSKHYVDSLFDTEIETIHSDNYLTILIKSKIESKDIRRLISEGDIKIVYKIENSQTGFRKVFEFSEFEAKIDIDVTSINGKLIIHPLLVSQKQIVNFSSPEFSEVIQGYSFDFNENLILGFSDSVYLEIEKDMTEIYDKDSIFIIKKDSRPTNHSFKIDIEQDKIVILASEKIYDSLLNLKVGNRFESTISSVLIVPCLIELLHKIFEIGFSERNFEFGDRAWYKILRSSILKLKGVDIEDSNLDISILELSQELLGVPIIGTVDTISLMMLESVVEL